MVRVFIQDSSVTTGAGFTGGLFSSTGLVISLIADNSATSYNYKSAATATIEDITTIGTFAAPTALNCRFKAVDATNLPGLYEIQFLDGVFNDAGSTRMIGRVSGVTNMAPTFFEIQQVAYNPDDAVRIGLTALPNAVADAAGGLPISDAGGLDLDAILADTAQIGAAVGASISADIAAVKVDTAATLVDTGTTIPATIATAQLDLDTITGASGVNLLTATQASIDAIETDTADMQPKIGAPAGASVSADIAAVKTDTGNLITKLTTGITSLAEWLGLLAGKQSGNATAITEIKATGAGSGTFDPTTDAQEAIRDNQSGSPNYEIKGSYMLTGTTLNYVYWLEKDGQRVGTISVPTIDILDKDAVTISFVSTPSVVGTNMAKGSGTFSPTDNVPYTVVAKATYTAVEYTGVLPAGATAA